MTPDPTAARPRVEGEREQEIYDAALDVLEELGYDLFTMDAVATRARASKATLYRRWRGKPELVVDAVLSRKPPAITPDTGTLRGDLLQAHCGAHGVTDPRTHNLLAAVVVAMSRDPELAEVYRREFIGPRLAASRAVFARAQARGEIAADLDVEILAPALAGIVLHRGFLLGEPITEDLVARIVDQVILPAAHGGRPPTA